MREYPKTENLFKRDPETHKLIMGELRDPAVSQIAGWTVTEKVDGTNIRVLLRLDGHKGTDLETGDPVRSMQVEVAGRSDRANVPGDLKDAVLATLNANWKTMFHFVEELTGDDDEVQVCLYGEGYGPGIQKGGGLYRADKGLRIFDVTTTKLKLTAGVPDRRTIVEAGQTWWRDWATVERAASACGLRTVPLLYVNAPLERVICEVENQAEGRAFSTTAAEDGGSPELVPEGVIARTDPYLYDYAGRRVMFKLKGADLPA